MVECQEGFMRDTSGSCVACPKDTYSDTIDATSCTSCPDETVTEYDGSRSVSSCVGKKKTPFLYCVLLILGSETIVLM